VGFGHTHQTVAAETHLAALVVGCLQDVRRAVTSLVCWSENTSWVPCRPSSFQGAPEFASSESPTSTPAIRARLWPPLAMLVHPRWCRCGAHEICGVEEQLRKRGLVRRLAPERRNGLIHPAQIRDTSDFETPESMPSAVTGENEPCAREDA
jgi:hypothetical protein